VVNWGNSPTGPFTVSASDGDSALEHILLDGLGPWYEAETVVEASWTDILTRPHAFWVLADSHNDVDEWREDNNEAAVGLDVDLAAADVKSAVCLVEPGQSADVTVTASISNLGDVAIHDIVVQLQDGDGQPITTTAIAELDPHAWTDASLSWPQRPEGSHTVVVAVDPHDLVLESDEDNNEVAGTVLVAAHRVLLPCMTGNGGR